MHFKRLLIIICLISFSLTIKGQDRKVNCIIQVNRKLVNGELGNMFIVFSDNPKEKFRIGYLPGELSIPKKVLLRLKDKSDTTSATFHFDYYSYHKNGKYESVNWKINLSPILFEQPYLILNIYDFRDKEFRKMYSHHTTEEYICEWGFPGSGVLISNK